jgi:hypothetical protein
MSSTRKHPNTYTIPKLNGYHAESSGQRSKGKRKKAETQVKKQPLRQKIDNETNNSSIIHQVYPLVREKQQHKNPSHATDCDNSTLQIEELDEFSA